jgi:hypothetical protein
MIGGPVTWCLAVSRRDELDELIADGRPASASRLLEERSRQLVKASRRVALAAQIEALVELAGAAPVSGTRRMPVWLVDLRVAEVRGAGPELRDLARALRSADALSARGVAMAMLLVRHGESPLYVDYGPGELVRAVQATTAVLTGARADLADR